ncbi:hypothetical protein ABEV55_19155 [Aneurinibacillus thermoaerophilus]|uniref:hypothetical protein n=1 Tax=Aneurinibacillus thermoaerophilus TaxID=143495 RepID=UPI002E1CD205|nr:hypothetical protein [Aneurinibacillus thermoaerophilus]
MAANPIEEMFREIVREEVGEAIAEIKKMLAGTSLEKEKLIGAEEISEFLGISKRRACELLPGRVLR